MQKDKNNNNNIDFIKIEPYQSKNKKEKYCSSKTVIVSFSCIAFVMVLSFLIVCLIRYFG